MSKENKKKSINKYVKAVLPGIILLIVSYIITTIALMSVYDEVGSCLSGNGECSNPELNNQSAVVRIASITSFIALAWILIAPIIIALKSSKTTKKK